MNTAVASSTPNHEISDTGWTTLYRLAATASLIGLVIIPVQVIVWAVSPPPSDVADYFALLQQRPVIGLMNLDLLYLLSNVLLLPLYLALSVSLRAHNKSLITLALATGLLALAVYLTTNPCLDMLSLSRSYAAATTEANRLVLLAAGETLLAGFSGTAFTVYYLLSSVALLLFAAVMFRSTAYSRRTAWMALTAGVLMLVPSSAGQVGIILAMASLVPWVAFSVLLVPQFLRMSRS